MADYAHAQEAVEEPIQASRTVDTDDMNGTLDEKYTEDEAAAAPPAGRDPEKQAKMEKLGTNDKYEITEDDCYDELGYSYSNKKKWYILTIIFIVQVSMNFNTSLYGNAIGGISKEFDVSKQGARVGAAIFLILYAFGCELWAPWSEEFGRWPILQLSLGLVNLWQIPVAIAPNFATIIAFRGLGGLSSAGGSVTLGELAQTPRGL
ncbi:hypothetical protein LTR29_001178 [Friedmanniomyces endolithicus]|nr:hypothetical protein LTR29_001178 [Friedmanniomyces endolithicus]